MTAELWLDVNIGPGEKPLLFDDKDRLERLALHLFAVKGSSIGESSCCWVEEWTDGASDAEADVFREEALVVRSWRNGILKAGIEGVRNRLVSVEVGGVVGGVGFSLRDLGDDTRDTKVVSHRLATTKMN